MSNVPGINGSWVRSSSRAPAIPEVPGPRLEPVPMTPVSPRREVEAGRKHSPAHRPEPEGPREEATSELRTERSRREFQERDPGWGERGWQSRKLKKAAQYARSTEGGSRVGEGRQESDVGG